MKRKPIPGMSAANIGSEFDAEQSEALKAIIRWRARHGRPPLPSEVVEILRELGWRKEEMVAA